MSRWEGVRAALFTVALAAGLAGMALEFRPLIWGAVALLSAAVGIRLVTRRRREP